MTTAQPESHKKPALEKFADNVFIAEYPITLAGCRFNSRMTVIRMSDGTLLLHSPCEIDVSLKHSLLELGNVSIIVAPSNYHSKYVRQCKEAFPNAQVYVTPSLEQKLSDVPGVRVLNDDDTVDQDIQHVFVSGNRIQEEIVFYHVPSKTLILTDLILNVGDVDRDDTNCLMKLCWMSVCMWNRAKPAPEYQFGWMCKNKQTSRAALERILEWDFDEVIIAHGQNITKDCKATLRHAWRHVLN